MNRTGARHIVLRQNEIDYLIDEGFLSSVHLAVIKNASMRSKRSAVIELTDAVAEEFREAFTGRLAVVGFDEEYELTVEGRLLEDLIDLFSDA